MECKRALVVLQRRGFRERDTHNGSHKRRARAFELRYCHCLIPACHVVGDYERGTLNPTREGELTTKCPTRGTCWQPLGFLRA